MEPEKKVVIRYLECILSARLTIRIQRQRSTKPVDPDMLRSFNNSPHGFCEMDAKLVLADRIAFFEVHRIRPLIWRFTTPRILANTCALLHRSCYLDVASKKSSCTRLAP